ncbi:Programmed cell death protein 6 [Sparganum proliferum]
MSLCYFCDEQYEEAQEKITSVLKCAREQNLTEWEFNGELLLAAIFSCSSLAPNECLKGCCSAVERALLCALKLDDTMRINVAFKFLQVCHNAVHDKGLPTTEYFSRPMDRMCSKETGSNHGFAKVFTDLGETSYGKYSEESTRTATELYQIPKSSRHLKAMIDLFSSARADYLNFEEFTHLWTFIQNWQKFFTAYDKDKSGLPFDRQKKSVIYFDDFIHLCVMLQKLTREFRTLDTDLDGWITVGYEAFLYHMLSCFS